MNKAYFIELATFNRWADDIAMQWLDQIDADQWNQTIASSFNSVKQTAVHIASAEKIWIDFWNRIPDPVFLSAEFNGTKDELIQIWRQASVGLQQFVETYPSAHYRKLVVFRYPRGGVGQMEFWQTCAHVVNHSTYHRGQLVTLLRQTGFTRFSSIDLATFYRLHENIPA